MAEQQVGNDAFIQALEAIRKVRCKYIHRILHPHCQIEADASTIYLHASKLALSIIGLQIGVAGNGTPSFAVDPDVDDWAKKYQG